LREFFKKFFGPKKTPAHARQSRAVFIIPDLGFHGLPPGGTRTGLYARITFVARMKKLSDSD
jgi:hypothetical protein